MPHAQDMPNGQHGIDSDAIAIIGLATRFPQEASTTEGFWNLLLQGRSAHTPFPEDRIGPGHYHPDPEHGGTHAVRGAHFLAEDPAYFDAPFFNITKGEAVSMDPQQRLVLENTYLALENSGLAIDKVASSNTSVFVSGFNQDHLSITNSDTETTMRYRVTGLTTSIISNRVSWFFDLKGPSVTVDTACSSSMVALHLGCQSLRTGESNMAIVAGVTVTSYPGDFNGMSYQGFLGQTGRCFSFDHRADGYARGEGVGSVVIKKLGDAIRDGNTIRAVIRGSGVAQDGRTPGLTLPDSTAQEKLMRRVYASAGLDMQATAMIEAHGTGTSAGDPIEASAIARAFASRSKKLPLYVGAVKSGTGHLEGAAGVAGVIKAVLVLEEGIIPRNVNFEKVNPKIPAKKWNLQFPTRSTPWPTQGLRRFSVNSFGVGGTNAHVILDDAYNYLRERGLVAAHNTNPRTPTEDEIAYHEQHLALDSENASVSQSKHVEHIDGSINGTTNGDHSSESLEAVNGTNGHSYATASHDCPPTLVMLSAFDEDGVSRNAKSQITYLKRGKRLPGTAEVTFLRDYAYTLSHRSLFSWRRFALGKNIPELIDSLESSAKAVKARRVLQIGYVFTGQGAQYSAMGRELLVYPTFQASLVDADRYFRSLGAPWSLLEELARSKEDSDIGQAYLAQPACTAIQVAIVELLRSWGVHPSRVVGHSSGEIAAAFAAGKLNRETAWKVAYYRGVVSGRKTSCPGAMMAVGLSCDRLQHYIEQVHGQEVGHLVIACLNSSKNNTVSGDTPAIDALQSLLEKDGVFARKLNVANAYHSHHMKELADEYLDLLGDISSEAAAGVVSTVHMFSTVTGARIEEPLDAAYWVENLTRPVQFAKGLDALCTSRTQKGQESLKTDSSAQNVFADVLIEIGPHGALQSAIKEVLATKDSGMTSLSVLNRSSPGVETILNTVGTLAVRGYAIDMEVVNQSWRPQAGDEPKLLVHVPGYAFNHGQKLFHESRLSKNYRLRKHGRHDLIGAPVADWCADAPRWRNILRVSEQPWLRDHIVTNAIILPGVGYLIAACEAIKQIADPEMTIIGYRLRDISLKRALIIPDGKDGVEVITSLAKYDESSVSASSTWRKFSIQSYNPVGEDWIEHCSGYISAEYQTAPGPVDNGREAQEDRQEWQRRLEEVSARCKQTFDFSQAYENLITTGLQFGPLFRNVTAATCSSLGEVLGVVTVPDVAGSMPKGHLSTHLIHPATMDSMMHFALGAIMDATGKTNLDAPMVPTFINEVWLSQNQDSTPGSEYRTHGKTRLVAFEKFESDVTVWDNTSLEPRIALKGIRATPLDSADGQGSGQERKLCHEITWQPYLPMLTNDQVVASVDAVPLEDVESAKLWNTKLQLATVLLVTDALDELADELPSSASGHYLKYFEWMKQLKAWILEDKIALTSRSEWERHRSDLKLKDQLYESVEGYNANGKLALRMGKSIVPVLRGEVDPLELMFGRDDLLDHVYGDITHLNDLPALQRAYLDVVGANSANLNILELGAGTGSSTAGVLRSLAPIPADGEDAQWSIAKYTFTDISAAFFEKARDKFKAHQDIMEYKVFDGEKDPADQGLELGTYDYVVAQNVVHATRDLKRTLSHLRRLLKPGGRLLLQEGVRQDYFWSGIAFGQLPGWWMGVESLRKWSPWIPSADWDDTLKASGFSGADLELPDSHDKELHTQSLFVASNKPEQATVDVAWDGVVLITDSSPNPAPANLVQVLKSELELLVGPKVVSTVDVDELHQNDLTRTLCIVLAEVDNPVLATLSESRFNSIRQMLTVCKGCLWVTGDIVQRPAYGMILGLMRTNRWERDLDEANLVTLCVGDQPSSSNTLAKSISSLIKQQFVEPLPVENHHGEFYLTGDRLLTSRLHSSAEGDHFLTSRFSKLKPVMTPLGSAGRPIKLSAAVPGLLDRLEWVTDEHYNKPLGDTEVEIDIKAVGLNFRDLMIAMGEHMAWSIGCEASGIVSRIGPKAQHLKVGDRVMYIAGSDNVGCFHTYGRLDELTVVKIPDSLSFEDAAGMCVVYATVVASLRDAGRLVKGEKVLIHAAAGGVGQAAIRYAQHIGAEVFATVSSLEKRDILIREHNVPEDHIFSSRDLTFYDGIKRATDGKGVDVVLNSLSGEALRRSWDLLAPFGRFVEIGKKDAQAHGRIELTPFLRNVTMTSVDFVTIQKCRPSLMRQLVEEVVHLWEQGVAKPAVPTKVMPMSQVQEGLQVLQGGKGAGKMIFVPSPQDEIPIVPAQSPPYEFRPDATYVLSGGLGGIGRSTAKWMVSRGARNLVFLSSSGRITEAVSKMQSDLEAEGCGVHIFKCDVSNVEQLRAVIAGIASSLPPVKGVIQGAMHLKDSMFENMPWEDYQTAIKPKVQGSWNLHEVLPKDMEFFIMLSSATGVLGNRAQANYAAGNTFQDQLAYHRRSLGLPASTLDLGTVLSVGYVAENKGRVAVARNAGITLELIREEEVHTLIELLIDPRNEPPPQLVAGLTTMDTYRSRGVPPPTYLSYPLFTHVASISAQQGSSGQGSNGPRIEALLNNAKTIDEAAAVVTTAIVAKLSSLLSISTDDINPERSVSSNGVDSLVAMEFRTFLAREVKADIPVLDIMGTLSINALSRKIASVSKAVDVMESKENVPSEQ